MASANNAPTTPTTAGDESSRRPKRTESGRKGLGRGLRVTSDSGRLGAGQAERGFPDKGDPASSLARRARSAAHPALAVHGRPGAHARDKPDQSFPERASSPASHFFAAAMALSEEPPYLAKGMPMYFLSQPYNQGGPGVWIYSIHKN